MPVMVMYFMSANPIVKYSIEVLHCFYPWTFLANTSAEVMVTRCASCSSYLHVNAFDLGMKLQTYLKNVWHGDNIYLSEQSLTGNEKNWHVINMKWFLGITFKKCSYVQL